MRFKGFVTGKLFKRINLTLTLYMDILVSTIFFLGGGVLRGLQDLSFLI